MQLLGVLALADEWPRAVSVPGCRQAVPLGAAKLCLGAPGDAPQGWLTLNVDKSSRAAASQIRYSESASFVNLNGTAVNVSSVNLYIYELKKNPSYCGRLKIATRCLVLAALWENGLSGFCQVLAPLISCLPHILFLCHNTENDTFGKLATGLR